MLALHGKCLFQLGYTPNRSTDTDLELLVEKSQELRVRSVHNPYHKSSSFFSQSDLAGAPGIEPGLAG
jgi:hypothetical protein